MADYFQEVVQVRVGLAEDSYLEECVFNVSLLKETN